MIDYNWYIIKQNNKMGVISISSPYFDRRAVLRSIGSMYENTNMVIRVYQDSFTYLDNGEEILVRALHGVPQYVCGLTSDDKEVMDKLMRIRRLL